MQSNIIWLVVRAVTGIVVLRGKKQFSLLLLALGWGNNVLHIILPICAVLDWILFADRPTLAWKRLWISLIYPMVWVVVVLIRGATDGWLPYPFLNPATGYGLVPVRSWLMPRRPAHVLEGHSSDTPTTLNVGHLTNSLAAPLARDCRMTCPESRACKMRRIPMVDGNTI